VQTLLRKHTKESMENKTQLQEKCLKAKKNRTQQPDLTLCRFNLNPYCLGWKAAFFSVGI
jgi:hypothetical protein